MPSSRSIFAARRAFAPDALSEGPGLYRVAALILAGACGVYYWRYSCIAADDAFIYFRLAENVANGVGPVLNAGDPPGAGTSLLWVYVLAAARILFGAEALPEQALVLATLFVVASCVLFSLSFRTSLGSIGLLTAPAIVSIPLLRHVPGLEIPLAVFALSLSTWCYFSLRSLPATGAAIAFSFFCRGDAVLLGLPLAAHFAYEASRAGRPRAVLRSAAGALVCFAGVLLVGIVWQYATTGSPLPATLRTKIIQGLEGPWSTYAGAILDHLRAALGGGFWRLIFVLAGAWIATVPVLALLATAALQSLAYSILSVASYPWYSWILQIAIRLLLVFGLAATAVTGWRLLARRVESRIPGFGPSTRRFSAALLVAACAVLTCWRFLSFPLPARLAPGSAVGGGGGIKTYFGIARFLREQERTTLHPFRMLLLGEEIGILGYSCPELELRDVNGLASPGLTRDNLNDWDYWIDRYLPEYLVVRGDGGDHRFSSSPKHGSLLYERVLMPHEPDFIPISVYRRDRASPVLESAQGLRTLLGAGQIGQDNQLRVVAPGRVVLFAPAPSELTADVPDSASRVTVRFGILPAPEEARGRADGVTFELTALLEDGSGSPLLVRHVPALIIGDLEEDQLEVVELSPPVRRLRFAVRPGESTDWDWSYWSEVRYD